VYNFSQLLLKDTWVICRLEPKCLDLATKGERGNSLCSEGIAYAPKVASAIDKEC